MGKGEHRRGERKIRKEPRKDKTLKEERGEKTREAEIELG